MPRNKTNSAVFSKSGKSYHVNDKWDCTNVVGLHIDIMCDHVIVWYARVKHRVIPYICTRTPFRVQRSILDWRANSSIIGVRKCQASRKTPVDCDKNAKRSSKQLFLVSVKKPHFIR